MELLFNIISIILLLSILVLGIIIVIKTNLNDRSRLFFLFFIIVIFIWTFVNYFLRIVTYENYNLILFILKSTYASGLLVFYVLLLFSLEFPKKLIKKKAYLVYLLIFIPVIFMIIATYSNWIVNDFSRQGIIFEPNYVSGFEFYNAFLYLLVLSVFFIMYKQYKISVGILKQQATMLFIGICIAVFFPVIASVIIPYFYSTNIVANFDYFSIIFLLGFTSYAILAHKLFDIQVVIKKTLIYSTLLTFVFGAYVLIVFSFTKLFGATTLNQTLIPGVLAALLIAFGYDPLKKWLTNITENKLFHGKYNSQDVLNNLSKILSSVLDLDEALDNIIHIIVRNMKLDKAAAFVLTQDPENETLIVKSVKSTGYKSKDIKLKGKNGLIEYFDRYIKKQKKEISTQTYIEEIETKFKKTKLIKIEEKIKIQPIVTDELDRMLELSGEKNKILNGVVKELKNLKAAVSMPIIVKGNLIGIFILGNKKSGDIFDSTDLNLLTIIVNQTAVAIEKARFYARDQLKSEFVSIVSHELLTPTSAIEGYLSMILEEDMGKVDKRARGYLEKVYESSQKLAKLVKDLLNVSRIEGSRIIIQSKNFDIRNLVKTVMSEMEPKAREKNLKLIAEGIDREVPEVSADLERVHQVLVSLASNSIKYTKKGTVTMKVDYSLSTVKVSIIDTGIGIKEDEIPHLFEKFYWTSNVDNRGAQGTGLGLYISKNIVELMGGMMNIDSEYGKGTTVSFSLPRGKIQSNNNEK